MIFLASPTRGRAGTCTNSNIFTGEVAGEDFAKTLSAIFFRGCIHRVEEFHNDVKGCLCSIAEVTVLQWHALVTGVH